MVPRSAGDQYLHVSFLPSKPVLMAAAVQPMSRMRTDADPTGGRHTPPRNRGTKARLRFGRLRQIFSHDDVAAQTAYVLNDDMPMETGGARRTLLISRITLKISLLGIAFVRRTLQSAASRR